MAMRRNVDIQPQTGDTREITFPIFFYPGKLSLAQSSKPVHETAISGRTAFKTKSPRGKDTHATVDNGAWTVTDSEVVVETLPGAVPLQAILQSGLFTPSG